MSGQHVHIDGRAVGPGCPPYVIAELSANHNGRLQNAHRLIEEAQKAGASAVKLQTYRPDTITLQCDSPEFRIHSGPWAGQTMYELYEGAHTPWEWHKPLFEKAKACGLTIFSSPFDTTAVDLLEDLGAPAYKIASFEMTDHSLVRYAASTGKPLIISTGMASEEEISETVEVARDAGCGQLVLLLCVSGYPAAASDYNLQTIPDMRERFGTLVGLSDHTLSNATAVASVALGACLIEKHFTLDRCGGGPDDHFSLEPDELRTLCADSLSAFEALGTVRYGSRASERNNRQFRRSLYVTQSVAAGEAFTPENVRSVRPGYGLEPKHLPLVLSKRAACDLQRGQAMRWEFVAQ